MTKAELIDAIADAPDDADLTIESNDGVLRRSISRVEYIHLEEIIISFEA